MVTSPKKLAGFTLAELLIGLAIMGLLAAMSVPVLLKNGSKTDSHIGVVKSTALAISSAYAMALKTDFTASINQFTNFSQNINTVTTDVTTNPSTVPSGETALTSCATNPCLQLQNGALLQYSATNTFNGNSPTNYITLAIDPDGAGSAAGKVSLLLYRNGRVVSGSSAYGTTGTGALAITADPAWLGTWGN